MTSYNLIRDTDFCQVLQLQQNNNTTVFRIFKFNVGVALVEEVPAPAWEQNNAWLQSATKMLGQLQLTHVQGV